VRHDPADVLMVEDDPGDALIVHLAAASCVVMTCWRDYAATRTEMPGRGSSNLTERLLTLGG
jgi:hypothetical protein